MSPTPLTVCAMDKDFLVYVGALVTVLIVIVGLVAASERASSKAFLRCVEITQKPLECSGSRR